MLVTGAKRDIALVGRVEATSGDELTVLDISFAVNARAVQRALESGARCRYFDHHHAGDVPSHPNLRTFIDMAPDVCTSLLVDRYLSGRQRMWAVVAAFGDNMAGAAHRAAQPLQLPPADLERLRELGESINYNAYGETVDDLHYHPADLYETLRRYRDPREFITGEPVFEALRNACEDDLCRADGMQPEVRDERCAVYLMPDAAWSRRVSGPFINRLARRHPARAHAVLVPKADTYTVSVRAAMDNPRGADELCLKFESGGGRKGAAGINHLPAAELDRFIDEFRRAYTA